MSQLQDNITSLQTLLQMVQEIPAEQTITLQSKNITPSVNEQTITPDSGYDGLNSVTILGDADLKTANIKKGVNIFGVDGSYEGVELNFEVVGGTSQPSSPTENTIWVNTNVEITGWHFSATQPENMASGEVWFAIGTFYGVAFNALKRNNIHVYPLKPVQYVGSELVEKTAKIYQNGKWVEIINDFYLYNNGVFSELAGTIISVAKKVGENQGGEHTLTINASNVTVSTQGGSGAWVYFPNKIDLSNYTTLCFNGAFNLTHEYGGGGRFGFGVWSETPTGDAVTQAAAFYGLVAPPLVSGVYTLDIESLKGEYYVGMALYGYGTSAVPYTQAVLKQMWVE